MKPVILATLALSLAAVGFAAGRLSAPHALEPRVAPATGMVLTQNSSPDAPQSPGATPQQAPNDPRELIPLGPGQQPGQGPGQRPGQQPGQAPGECPVQIYQDGKLYTFPQPGQQPGQGNGPQPGQPGQPQELIPLGPGNGGTPAPAPSQPTPPAVPPGTRS
jgi:hypothetical protein